MSDVIGVETGQNSRGEDESWTNSWYAHVRGMQRGWKMIENGNNLGQLAMAKPDSCMLVAGALKHVRGNRRTRPDPRLLREVSWRGPRPTGRGLPLSSSRRALTVLLHQERYATTTWGSIGGISRSGRTTTRAFPSTPTTIPPSTP